jgi:hypothetical protein
VRSFRLLVLLLTVLTLPVYGMAAVTHVRSCQMQLGAGSQQAMAGDCCPGKADPKALCKRLGDFPAPGKNGPCTPCKAGYNCKSPQSYEPTHLLMTILTSSRPTVTIATATFVFSHSPGGLWRPPRLI